METPKEDNSESGSGGSVAADPPSDEEAALEIRAAAIQEKLEEANRQVAILNQRIRDLKRLYNRAVENNRQAFRYSYRIQMSVVADVKLVFYHYACLQAAELEDIERQIEEARSRCTATHHPPGGPVSD